MMSDPKLLYKTSSTRGHCMIKHIVCFKLKDSATKQETARHVKQQIELLPGMIPEIKRMEVGINFVDAPVAYDVALYADFASREALDTYVKHPDHLKVGQSIGQYIDKAVVVDYEV
jgi:hypothetical protein